ncbi:MAG: hypothetical protein ABSC05_12815 [Candidatus Solibacter sp.]
MALSKLRPDGHEVATAARITGSTLVVYSQVGMELWRHTFADQLVNYPPGSLEVAHCSFADIDGDGRIETIFRLLTTDAAAARLVCFDPDGKIRWEFVPGGTVADNRSHQYLRPYGIQGFAAVRRTASTPGRVVVTSVHNWSFPCQVAVLDGKTGKAVSEYWHHGHLLHMAVADIDGDGEPEILLGGVNDADEYKQATVVVFDHRRIAGASSNPKGEVYFQGMTAGTEKAIILFPRSPISKDEEFNRVSNLRAANGRIVVSVAEGVGEGDPPILYELDYSFRPTNAVFSGQLVQRWHVLQEAGKIRKDSLTEMPGRLQAEVKVIHSGSGQRH